MQTQSGPHTNPDECQFKIGRIEFRISFKLEPIRKILGTVLFGIYLEKFGFIKQQNTEYSDI